MTLNPSVKVIEVEVAQDDIDRGIKGDPYLCPVARAISRAISRAEGVNLGAIAVVGSMDAVTKQIVATFYRINFGSLRMQFHRFPDEVTEFVRKFDNGEPVEPFKFVLVKEMQSEFSTSIEWTF